ncbi:MAG: radical SAM family heme chaperone HemW, partial [Gemmatimonadaceae bacterium]
MTSYQHVYVHVPFCARRCSYCDFAIAVRAHVPVADYIRAVEDELTLRAIRNNVALDTLYLGGGTPSRLGADGVARLIGSLRKRLTIADDAEVTVEANPDDIHPGVVERWKAAGVNRVSLGVQSFDPAVLTWMHRSHNVADVERAISMLRDEQIDDWSLDLIYALPPEIPRDWAADVERAVELAPPHISAYGLTVEPATPLARWRARGEATEADEERYEHDFLFVDSQLRNSGYDHYEVSNYARNGQRARHNSAYWKGVPYLGVGPAAHGFDGETRRWNVREYAAWR